MTEFQLDESLLRAKSIGDKVEVFYLQLATASAQGAGPDLYLVAECLQHVEEHQPITPLGESSRVVDEIVIDCRKKAVQCIRNAYTQHVQTMIVNCRKRLITKINRNASDEDAKNHGSRHFNLLKELLGKWSNIINEISSLGLSMETIHAVLKPLHSRIIDCSVDCMQQFQNDKNLETWHQRVLNANRYEDRSDGSGNIKIELPFSILTLDNLVAQVAAMREIVGTYYAFLDNLSYSTALYDASEINQWRELDVMYMSLEAGYLTHAVAEATRETALVEVQTGVLVPQCIEDTFFIVTRVAERCMSTLAHQALMTVANKILEIVDVDTASSAMESEPDNESLRLRPPWLLQEQRSFLGCSKRGSIDIQVLRADAHTAAGGASEVKPSSNGTPLSSIGAKPSLKGKNNFSNTQLDESLPSSTSKDNLLGPKIGSLVGSELAEELQLGAEVISDVSTAVVGLAQGWWSARDTSRRPPSSETDGAAASAGDGQASEEAAPKASSSNENLAGALIAALEADVTQKNGFGVSSSSQALPSQGPNGALDSAFLGLSLLGGSAAGAEADLILGCHNTYTSYNSHKNHPNPHSLSTPDWAVLLNALNATRLGIANIKLLFSEACGVPAGETQGKGQLASTAQLIITELARAEAVYRSWFSRHAEDLFLEPFLLYVATPLAEEVFGDHDFYAIDADEMDRRISAVGGGRAMLLVRIIEAFIHKPALAGDESANPASAAPPRAAPAGPEHSQLTSPSRYHLQGNSEDAAAAADEEGDPDKEERARAREAEAEAQRVAAYSVLDRCVRPYCSAVTFSAVLHQLAEFTCEQLLLEIIGEEIIPEDEETEAQPSEGRRERVGGACFSEWGALLFNNEVLAVIEIFELADERCQASQSSAADAAAPGQTSSASSTTRIRNVFYPLMWALKLLTLDKASDVSRYRLPTDTFSVLESAPVELEHHQHPQQQKESGGESSPTHGEGNSFRARRKCGANKRSEEKRPQGEITAEIARQILVRRVDFSETSVNHLKINIV